MFVISGTAKIRPDQRQKILGQAIEMVALSAKEPGCGAYEFSEVLGKPNVFRLFEQWENDDALRAHFATPHFASFSAALGAALVETPQFLRYEVSRVENLSAGN